MLMNSLTVSDPLVQVPEGVPSADRYAIEVEQLGVRYRLPSISTSSVKEFVIRMVKGELHYSYHWALRDINLKVRTGEILGLVGHNGAGKSTLLKVVARILKPTEGRMIVRGDVATLLGVGAGFHQELTGRENVYLNGTILGFSMEEMNEKFDRIVDFAELWDYIDQPIRTYSSGMRARLGFAIATDSKPDILIVDEILSVGDEAFRKKSADRMKSFRDQGTTILLVSHSMNTIQDICHRVAWIHQGQLRMIGEVDEVVERYLEERRRHTQKQNPGKRA